MASAAVTNSGSTQNDLGVSPSSSASAFANNSSRTGNASPSSELRQNPSFEAPLCASCGDALCSTVQCVSTGFLCEQPHYLETLRKYESYACCTPNSYDEHPCCWDQTQKLVFASTAPSARKARGSESQELPTLGYRSAPLELAGSIRGKSPRPAQNANANSNTEQEAGPDALEDTSITPIYCFCIQHLDCSEEKNGVPPCYCCTAIIAPAICSFPLRACFHVVCCLPECLIYCHHGAKARSQFKEVYGIKEGGCSACLALSCFSLAAQQMRAEKSLRPPPKSQAMKLPPAESAASGAPSPSPSISSLALPSETKVPENNDNGQR